jgi:hypothetical protein
VSAISASKFYGRSVINSLKLTLRKLSKATLNKVPNFTSCNVAPFSLSSTMRAGPVYVGCSILAGVYTFYMTNS